jgi:hypothetical protein
MEAEEVMPDPEEALAGVDDEKAPLSSESISDRLRRQRKNISEQTTTDVDIPGYNGDLFCRYKLLDGAELDAIMRRARSSVNGRLEQVRIATMDNIINSCEEFWLRDEGKEFPVRQHPDVKSDLPVRYDETLAEFMGFKAELPEPLTARSVLLAVFGGNDIAVSAHGAVLARWMMRSGTELDELLGGV